jgi:hypothetical protein
MVVLNLTLVPAKSESGPKRYRFYMCTVNLQILSRLQA